MNLSREVKEELVVLGNYFSRTTLKGKFYLKNNDLEYRQEQVIVVQVSWDGFMEYITALADLLSALKVVGDIRKRIIDEPMSESASEKQARLAEILGDIRSTK